MTVSTSSGNSTAPSSLCVLITLPAELQVNLLTYLRAFDLASVQLTCRYYAAPALMDSLVRHAAERVYPPELSHGFDQQPVVQSLSSSQNPPRTPPHCLTVEHLRNMELVVIARVLARPEPTSGGFVVSKSWCKAALRWLEVREQHQLQQQQNSGSGTTKKTGRKQKVRNRRLSDVCPPWPNVNSDLLCEHANLSCLGNNKSARARRRLLDKQAWKALSNLYPDSTPLDAVAGECYLCQSAARSAREDAEHKEQAQLQQRKKPLGHPAVRQFYTRTRGVPVQALRGEASSSAESAQPSCVCPLRDGVYYLLPRVWCQGWRRYIKTGEVGAFAGSLLLKSPPNASPLPPPPDVAGLLCAAHRLPLFPAHLEAYLNGQTTHLFASQTLHEDTATVAAEAAGGPPAAVAAAAVRVRPVVGLRERADDTVVDQAVLQSLQAAGLSPAEVTRQLQALRLLEYERHAAISKSHHHNNHANAYTPPDDWVEILTDDEYIALLDEQRWSGSAPDPAECVSFRVQDGTTIRFAPTQPCRDCHPGARRYCGSKATNTKTQNDLRRSCSKQKKHRGGTKVSRPNANLAPSMSFEY